MLVHICVDFNQFLKVLFCSIQSESVAGLSHVAWDALELLEMDLLIPVSLTLLKFPSFDAPSDLLGHLEVAAVTDSSPVLFFFAVLKRWSCLPDWSPCWIALATLPFVKNRVHCHWVVCLSVWTCYSVLLLLDIVVIHLD